MYTHDFISLSYETLFYVRLTGNLNVLQIDSAPAHSELSQKVSLDVF